MINIDKHHGLPIKSGDFPWLRPQANLWWPCKEEPNRWKILWYLHTNIHRGALDTKIDMNLMMSLYDIKPHVELYKDIYIYKSMAWGSHFWGRSIQGLKVRHYPDTRSLSKTMATRWQRLV